MQPNRRYDSAQAGSTARGAKVADISGLPKKYTSPRQDVTPSQAAILRNWADYLVLIATMLARREPVSRAGQDCLLHVADLLREIAR